MRVKIVGLICALKRDKIRLSKMLNAFRNLVRFSILRHLAEKQMCITGDIVLFITLAQSTISRHLKVPREAGLIEGEMKAPATCYCIGAAGVQVFLLQMERWLSTCCLGAAADSFWH